MAECQLGAGRENRAPKLDKPSPTPRSSPCRPFQAGQGKPQTLLETHHCAVKSTNSLEKRSAGSWGDGSSTTCLSCWKGVPQDSYGKRRMASSIWGQGPGRRETSGSPPPHAARRLRGCSGLRFRMKTLFPYQQFSIWVMLPFFFFLLFKYKNPEAKNTSF